MSVLLAALLALGAWLVAFGLFLRYGLKARIDLVAYPKGEPPQTAAVHFIGTPARGANLTNRRGAPELPDGWEAMGYALNFDVDNVPVVLLEEGGQPMPTRRPQ